MFGAPNQPFSGCTLRVGVPHHDALMLESGTSFRRPSALQVAAAAQADMHMPVGDARATAAVRPRAHGARALQGDRPFPTAMSDLGMLGCTRVWREIAGHEARKQR